ncbi:MAG: 3-phosphoshikimate 1-carboxyvinyltransferase [Candidatus Omnitrophica bacterium]|nr:3-phosphoshikimate 1-carboxyvinyltransferase [Candidatus Omnitrophota bacterium]MDD5552911.1 3-phosphoshikimate 1-carboxyvinyltransferase [Candidatus Omnitrophota bacterium]
MSFFAVNPARHAKGKVSLPGDKSIACRSIIISSLSKGKTTIKNFPPGKDPFYAVQTFKRFGIKIIQDPKNRSVRVLGKGLYGLKAPRGPINTGDSGTTFRLSLGVLAGQRFRTVLTAGSSLSKRPMLRVISPLRAMGAAINSGCKLGKDEYPPVTITGADLKPITFRLPVASAQVKSAVLLAGLYPEGKTTVIEAIPTRDHTERMLRLFKAEIKVHKNSVVIKGGRELAPPAKIIIPGDISSAAFFLVLGTILPGSRILIKNVNLNPSRAGIITILKRMGGRIKVTSHCPGGRGLPSDRQSHKPQATSWEPVGNLQVESSKLRGTLVRRAEIPALIDEIPILMVAACFAKGRTVFEGAEELRVKETDRIRSMSENLMKMGADIRLTKISRHEKIIIHGGTPLLGAKVKSFSDHRTAMSMVIAGLGAQGRTCLDDVNCISKSFPGFLSLLRTIVK